MRADLNAPWPEEQKRLLIEMWPTHSARQLVRRLKRSRSAVLGKVFRLKLPGKGKEWHRRMSQVRYD